MVNEITKSHIESFLDVHFNGHTKKDFNDFVRFLWGLSEIGLFVEDDQVYALCKLWKEN